MACCSLIHWGNGKPAKHAGDWSIYAVADQLVWLEPGTKDQGMGIFGRVMGGPGDRNVVNLYADTGITHKGALPGRDRDTVGVAVACAPTRPRSNAANGPRRFHPRGDAPIG